mgnify:CR=1 FL=1
MILQHGGVICDKCGKRNVDYLKVCLNCGKRLPKRWFKIKEVIDILYLTGKKTNIISLECEDGDIWYFEFTKSKKFKEKKNV